MLKRALLGATALVLLAGTASAADLATRYPVKAAPIPVQVFSWTGFYIGGNVGWGWADNTYDYTPFAAPTYSYNPGTSNGFTGGLQMGYNYQFVNNVVLGVETDFNWADIIRARLGYAMDRFLPYITGGVAYANTKYTDPFGFSDSNLKWGWTAGAGLEYAITNNWTVKAEYLYLGFDNSKTNYFNGDQLSVGSNIQTARVGVNYKF